MVDALLVAAQSEDSEYFEDKEEVVQVPQLAHAPSRTHSIARTCEFCRSSNTPTWRRGPGGKGSLCNACGIKWRLRKRKKGDAPTENKSVKLQSPVKKRRASKDSEYQPDHMTQIRTPIVFQENITQLPSSPTTLDSRKNYFCKFCNRTWDFNCFKNSQQFGAHCSNCSRRSPGDGLVPHPLYLDGPSSPTSASKPFPSPSSYFQGTPTTKRFPPPPFDDAGSNLMLILRLMQEDDDFTDEETMIPHSPTTLPTPTPVL